MLILAASLMLAAAAAPPPEDIRGQGLATTPAARFIDPTWLRAYVPQLPANQVALSSATARYKPIFGEGAPYAALPRGISRYGELQVSAGGRSGLVRYAREEHLLVILEGEGTVSYGGREHPVRANDFVYLPPGVEFGLNSRGASSPRGLLMGFRIPEGSQITVPASIQMANINDVPLVLVGGHPPSTLYRLLVGDTKSTRDRLATGHIMKSLYVMEFDPGGTNFPHHHEHEEEIYFLMNGEGQMVAGGGEDGVEGRFTARAGDAYYYRANTTVGFYNSPVAGEPKARILAVRSTAPLRREGGGE
jgi:mannose-6-phosphate isomerase-like protein (cupin superfamily)